MRKYIIYRVHHNGLCGCEALSKGKTLTGMIETAQRNLRKCGQPDGITYRVHEGDIVSALRETTKI